MKIIRREIRVRRAVIRYEIHLDGNLSDFLSTQSMKEYK